MVGARAAGAATAMLLADSGMKVLLVDRSRYGVDTLSTHALMRGGVMQLHRWGLLEHIIDKGTPPVRSVSFTTDTSFTDPHQDAARRRRALRTAPHRARPDPGRRRRSRPAPRCATASPSSGVRRNYKGRVTGVVGRDEKGQGIHFDAGLVIGADGMRSTIAQRVGAPVVRSGTERDSGRSTATGVTSRRRATSGSSAPPPERGSSRPTTARRACSWAATAAKIGTGGPDVMRQLLCEASPALAARVAAATAPLGVRTFLGRPGLMRRPWGPGWALVGDAGYWKDPISAHGLTDALRDAELLARAVISAGGGCTLIDAALRGYQETRDRLSFPLFDVTDALASFTWTDDDIGALLLEMSSSMKDEVDAIAALDAVAVGC